MSHPVRKLTSEQIQNFSIFWSERMQNLMYFETLNPIRIAIMKQTNRQSKQLQILMRIRERRPDMLLVRTEISLVTVEVGRDVPQKLKSNHTPEIFVHLCLLEYYL